jgi:hypothetical protein
LIDQAALDVLRPIQIIIGSGITQTVHVTQIQQVSNLSYQIAVSGSTFVQVEDTVTLFYPVVSNDIIEYNGAQWILSFDSSQTTQVFVLNQYSQKWFTWLDQQWTAFPTHNYTKGKWRLSL